MKSMAGNKNQGRGALSNPQNRFNALQYIPDWGDEPEMEGRDTRFYEHIGQTILNRITSPDIPLSWSLNPYQGCEHGCVYCYARNSHEYWGFSAGRDFESRIMVKRNAADLLKASFLKPSWKVVPISLSGNTDCYQPIERKLRITRQILEVCLSFGNPVGIITKNSLILRDLDILKSLQEKNLIKVFVSITSTDETLRRKMEPRTTTYSERFRIIHELSQIGIPTGVMMAPVIPALNDAAIYEVLRRSSAAGARFAGYTILRLNGKLDQIFTEWMQIHFPNHLNKVIGILKSCHGGKVQDSRYGFRMKGEGTWAELIRDQFALYCKKFSFNEQEHLYNVNVFQRNRVGQLSLF